MKRTLEFDIVSNVPYTKDLLAFPSLMPLREDIVEANPEGWSVEIDTQVSNGRYVISEFAHESQIVLTMSTTYWDAATTKLGTLTCMLSDERQRHPGRVQSRRSGSCRFDACRRARSAPSDP